MKGLLNTNLRLTDQRVKEDLLTHPVSARKLRLGLFVFLLISLQCWLLFPKQIMSHFFPANVSPKFCRSFSLFIKVAPDVISAFQGGHPLM